MSIKKEKEMFEEWYEKHHNGRQISCDYVYEDNSYSIGYANAMWINWQASANREGYKLVPLEASKACLSNLGDVIFDNFGTTTTEVDRCAEKAYKAMIGADE